MQQRDERLPIEPHKITKECTKGAQTHCEFAKTKECSCDCGGENHGIKAVK